jgi:hypothetical protein
MERRVAQAGFNHWVAVPEIGSSSMSFGKVFPLFAPIASLFGPFKRGIPERVLKVKTWLEHQGFEVSYRLGDLEFNPIPFDAPAAFHRPWDLYARLKKPTDS